MVELSVYLKEEIIVFVKKKVYPKFSTFPHEVHGEQIMSKRRENGTSKRC